MISAAGVEAPRSSGACIHYTPACACASAGRHRPPAPCAAARPGGGCSRQEVRRRRPCSGSRRYPPAPAGSRATDPARKLCVCASSSAVGPAERNCAISASATVDRLARDLVLGEGDDAQESGSSILNGLAVGLVGEAPVDADRLEEPRREAAAEDGRGGEERRLVGMAAFEAAATDALEREVLGGRGAARAPRGQRGRGMKTRWHARRVMHHRDPSVR